MPLGVHGDGGTMHGGEKITAISWGGLVRKGSTVDTRLMFIVIKDSEAIKGNTTIDKAYEVLAWSLSALATGTYPATDHAGRPFGPDHWPDRAKRAGSPLAPKADGRRLCGAWAELRGDWDYLRAALGLRHHYNRVPAQMCHLCAACGAGPLAYGDHFSADGPLRSTLAGPFCTGPNAWAATTPHSSLTKIPGFSIWRCMFDIMHVLDLGILQRLVPAALQGLLGMPAGSNRSAPAEEASFWPARSYAARCQLATNAYHLWAQDTKVPHSSRVKRITPRWTQGATPELLQKHAKAAALRAMLPWVAQVAKARQQQTNSQVATLRATCLGNMAALDGVYTRQGRFLTRAQEKQATEHCLAALQALKDLCGLQPNGPWKLQPKCHALLHIVLDSAMLNPRHAHCYQDEDFIGRTKRTYTACHGATAPVRTVQRYCMGTSLMLTAREQLLRGERSPKKARLATGGPLRGAARAVPSSTASSDSSCASQKASSSAKPQKPAGTRRVGRPKMLRPHPRPRGRPAHAQRG